ncbi:MAG: Copper amine oxidase-like protein [Parcubacteria group bacterium]|nr:Copper amine oxidase-like protein [Parcubacteria group bacterium]
MKRSLYFFLVLFSLVAVHHAEAATFEVSGWIPYWRSATGTQEALMHLDAFTEINPFVFTIKKDGRLNDAAGIDAEPWATFMQQAKAKKVRVIPTLMWGDPDQIHMVLSNKILRDAQIRDIVMLVNKYNFDGIDIDYEAKYSKTKDYYSLFLKDLYKAMGKKFVQCEIESRTPVTSRYDNVPADYDPKDVANDYVAINKYCDRVRIMAYDQGRVDLKLNHANTNTVYAPVSDPQWVKKLVDLAAQTISKKKIMIGIPTYGYEYQVTPGGIDGYTYTRLWAFNPKYALDIAKSLNITPQRTSAGELGFIYSSTSTPATNYMVWSDAGAIKEKIDLAKSLGVRGVSIFKIDGGMDPLAWSSIK